MADTYGLMKTRAEWTKQVENGETTLSHAEWYKKKILDEQTKGQEKPSLAMLSVK